MKNDQSKDVHIAMLVDLLNIILLALGQEFCYTYWDSSQDFSQITRVEIALIDEKNEKKK